MAEAKAETVVRRPAAPLVPLIERYVGYRLTGYPPGVHRGAPSRYMTFIVNIGPDIDVLAQSDPSQSPGRYGCVVGGLQASAALIAHDGNQEGVAIDLTPLGSRALLRMPARALWNTSVELGDLVGPFGPELWERLQVAESWDDRFAVCDDVLIRLLVGEEVVAPELRHSWHQLVASGGTVRVAELASTVGWTRQHLARRFGDEFGLSPRLAGRVIRFERARRMLLGTPSFVSIAQVAVACGYYDQAHMTRDFVALVGCSPARLVSEDLPSVQDAEDAVPSR